MASTAVNPEVDQDRTVDLLDHFNKFGHVMFRQQQRIYELLAERIEDRHVIEAGCGTGVGTAVLAREARHIIGTDKLLKNLELARCLYPWIPFMVWDINNPRPVPRCPVVVCIETIEHVGNVEAAVKNLLDAATEEVWISTPNGKGKPRPPENPHHVLEYTPQEMLALLGPNTEIFGWENLEPLTVDTEVNPLVYRVKK